MKKRTFFQPNYQNTPLNLLCEFRSSFTSHSPCPGLIDRWQVNEQCLSHNQTKAAVSTETDGGPFISANPYLSPLSCFLPQPDLPVVVASFLFSAIFSLRFPGSVDIRLFAPRLLSFPRRRRLPPCPATLAPSPTARFNSPPRSACIMNVCHIRRLISVGRCRHQNVCATRRDAARAPCRPDCVIDFRCLLSGAVLSRLMDSSSTVHRHRLLMPTLFSNFLISYLSTSLPPTAPSTPLMDYCRTLFPPPSPTEVADCICSRTSDRKLCHEMKGRWGRENGRKTRIQATIL